MPLTLAVGLLTSCHGTAGDRRFHLVVAKNDDENERDGWPAPPDHANPIR